MKKLILLLTILFTQIIVAQTFEENKRLAEQGDAIAQNNLGICYQFGKETLKDLQKTVYWYKKAAEQGNSVAQFNLSLCYTYGEGILKDLKKADFWCKKAYENGSEKAKKHWEDEELWKYE